ncbi:MAG: hypothetical protein ABSB13_09415 [Candidatus Binatus sp.]|jgi:hypothetical protein|uniref:hypothetical protein n=1 Tax=Candidatus Binatus sp. TaxID=2811406 RepID=UPI003D0C41AF
MRLIKLIVPAVLIAVLALFAPHADAQTMGEYAPTTAGVGTAGGSMGTSVAPPSFGSNDGGGGSGTWGASGLGASFEERARRASASGLGANFESRAGSTANRWTGDSRWPASAFTADTSNRFGGSSDRFPDRGELSSSSNRFPASALSGNRMGLDTSNNALDN